MTRERVMALLTVVALFLVDRASKLWIESHFTLSDSFSVIPGIFNLVHTQNTGAAFMMMVFHILIRILPGMPCHGQRNCWN